MQVESATDIIFKDQKTLAPIYEELVRTLSHAVKPNNISFFKHHRKVEHRDGTSSYKVANMRKTI